MHLPSILSQMSALQLLLSAALAISAIDTAVAAGPAFVEKSLGSQTVRLPVLAAFPAACEENRPLAERAASLAPKSSNFVTCFVPADKLILIREGKVADLYPYVTVTVDPPHPSGPFTLREFQQLRQATRAKLGELRSKSNDAQRQLQTQDANIAARGGDLKREDYQQQLSGFFDAPGKFESFSFLVNRSAKVSEAGASTTLCEMNAVTTILYSGRLLRVLVIDDCSGATPGLRAREITAAWLTALSRLNSDRN
ncbi:hypothetical protein SAMN05518854_1262 [Variovorax sp. YR266]|uniref:hypothetical protein n=1 Tax=Variovorax sp. YR266 TaxID=1884386 RepID=UPI0008973D9D|nr:hypothetical protein [Variovorax sp. YR266]SDZ72272.1 hypothetical protein SAMN05518854_1262 [Variovorax sp. YR266]